MKTLIISLCFMTVSAFATDMNAVEQEAKYNEFYHDIVRGEKSRILTVDSDEADQFVTALWNIQEEKLAPERLEQVLLRTDSSKFPLALRLRLAVLMFRQGLPFANDALKTELTDALLETEEDGGGAIAQLIISLRHDLQNMNWFELITIAYILQPRASALSLGVESPVGDQTNVAKTVWQHEPDLAVWSRGEYAESVRLYMFCRSQRYYPCIMIMRDREGKAVRTEDGKLWFHQSLGSSVTNDPSNRVNGNTPAGIHTIDGVMPSADNRTSFGKFRRLILDFVPSSKREEVQKQLLPRSSHNLTWWQPNVVARNVGRKYFRIHGTGRPTSEPGTPWYPFMRTHGCIAQRENTYDGVEYKDQRLLLDTMMTAMALTPAYANERAIKGLLFMMDLNDEARAVTLADLAAIGIK